MIDVNDLEILNLNSPHIRSDITIDVVHNINKATLGPGATDDDTLRAFFVNTQAKFNEIVDSYQRGSDSYNLQLYADYGVRHLAYSHLRHFAWIYWKQLLQLQRILNGSPENEDVVVVDLGTGGGNFILTAAYFLSDEELSRVSFIGIDKRDRDKRFGQEMAEQIQGLNVDWVEDDITDETFVNRLSTYNADLIVVNHVMEHLPGDMVDYLSNWSKATTNTLMVSIPLGDDLDASISDHEHDFDVEELEEIAQNVEMKSFGVVQTADLDETKLGGCLVAIGKGRISEEGKVTPLEVKVNDQVLFGRYAGSEIKIGATDYLIIKEDDILGIIR
jgi:chaperonin GroES